MRLPFSGMPNPRGVLVHIGKWSARMPARLKNKLVRFEQTIETFRQRRWS